MSDWEPTIGKWNDDENYYIIEPQWKLALRYAEEKYNTVDAYWDYKDGVEKGRIPYITFVRNVLEILICEAHLENDYLLTLGALARVTEITGCELEEIIKTFLGISDELREFPERNTTDIIEYYAGVFSANHKDTTMYILLAELLFTLRQETCPFADWEEDVKYYLEIEKLIDQYLIKKPHDRICFLCEKIKEQLISNRNESINKNKKPEELFAGWEE